MTLKKIISGGQSGADEAALWTAKEMGLETGGYIMKGFITEVGPKPEYANMFNLVEFGTTYPQRTEKNVIGSDGTVWFGTPGKDDAGYYCTKNATRKWNRPFFVVNEDFTTPSMLAGWILDENISVLNCAGSRASKYPKLFGKVNRFLTRVITVLRSEENEETF